MAPKPYKWGDFSKALMASNEEKRLKKLGKLYIFTLIRLFLYLLCILLIILFIFVFIPNYLINIFNNSMVHTLLYESYDNVWIIYRMNHTIVYESYVIVY